LDRFGFLIDLSLERPRDLEHVLVVKRDAFGSLVDVAFQVG
jgi:hypothetical protein